MLTGGARHNGANGDYAIDRRGGARVSGKGTSTCLGACGLHLAARHSRRCNATSASAASFHFITAAASGAASVMARLRPTCPHGHPSLALRAPPVTAASAYASASSTTSTAWCATTKANTTTTTATTATAVCSTSGRSSGRGRPSVPAAAAASEPCCNGGEQGAHRRRQQRQPQRSQWPQVQERRRTRSVGAAADASTGVNSARTVTVYDFSDQVIDYEQAWDWQKALLARAAAAADSGLRGSANALLILQHPPVYTLGAGSTTDHLRFPPGDSPIPLFRTERGGEVTYHGPGQLVVYPILDLQALTPDLHWYLRQLEQVVIEALDSVSGLSGERLEGLTGVWVGGAKVAAIGVRAKKWVSYHGLALNVTTDLGPFRGIVPCGIADRAVTSVQTLLAERAVADDPFSPASAYVTAGAGPDGAGAAGGGLGPEGEEIQLAEATQEDLRRMLAATGMTPPVITDSPPLPPAATTTADLEDPFAPLEDAGLLLQRSSVANKQPPHVEGPGAVGRSTAGGDGASGRPAGAITTAGAGAVEKAETRTGPQPPQLQQPQTMQKMRVRSEWSADERLLLREYSFALLAAVEEVFEVELIAGDPSALEALVG